MELANQQTLPCNRQQAWDALNDMDMLRRAIPGCESVTPTGENQFEMVVAASVGPVKARFKSRLTLVDVVPPTSYTMLFDGQGGPAGYGKGTARVNLIGVDARSTSLDYAVAAQVGGKIAQIGSRLVDMAAQRLAQDFFTNLRHLLEDRYSDPVQPEPTRSSAPATADKSVETASRQHPTRFFARLLEAMRRLFGARARS